MTAFSQEGTEPTFWAKYLKSAEIAVVLMHSTKIWQFLILQEALLTSDEDNFEINEVFNM